jgi:diguanylate cyclase (GGDEF)-like protein
MLAGQGARTAMDEGRGNAIAMEPFLRRRDGLSMDAALSRAELALFDGVGRRRTVASGERLFARGENGRTMFVVLEGRVELDIGGDLSRKTLGPGEFFGELGLLIGDHVRSAGARALAAAELIELGDSELERLLDRDPRLVAHFLHRAITRIVRNEQVLTHRLRRHNHELQDALDRLRAATQALTRSEELVRRDDLTGLGNRRACQEHIDRLTRDHVLSGYALLLVDCDAFKRVNDMHGHQVGDRVLQNVANILTSVAGVGDTACRFGGDEFALLVHARDQADLQRMAEYIVGTARGLAAMQTEPPAICTLSIGGCWIDSDSEWNDWYAHADAALYRVKRRGGDGIAWHASGEP